jgi:hypothetical protein
VTTAANAASAWSAPNSATRRRLLRRAIDDAYCGRVQRGDEDFEAVIAETRGHEREFLELTEPEAVALAERLGLQLRVLRSPDDAITLDYRPRRVTVDVSTGKVAKAFAG